MHTLLIVGGLDEERLDEAKRRITQLGVSIGDPRRCLIIRGQDDPQASIGIDDIRTMQRWAANRGTHTAAVVVDGAHRLTVPAQNALLKLLEEPGESLRIMLTVSGVEDVLPTVRSRCFLVRLGGGRRELGGPPAPPVTREYLESLFSQSPSHRIAAFHHKISDTGVALTRETAEQLLISWMYIVRSETGRRGHPTPDLSRYGDILARASEALYRLKHQCSPLLTIQQFLLDIARSP